MQSKMPLWIQILLAIAGLVVPLVIAFSPKESSVPKLTPATSPTVSAAPIQKSEGENANNIVQSGSGSISINSGSGSKNK